MRQRYLKPLSVLLWEPPTAAELEKAAADHEALVLAVAAAPPPLSPAERAARQVKGAGTRTDG